ncbi:MAG: LacI family DNA-binding transcriptional regulator [Spirochaetaceae bacterium]|nr:LacI family DNA-binding transcriptional regulator [Spirochaetaceae bacterium]
MAKSGRPTIKDVAELAGVSKTAVSFAFNSPERISTETYQRIMDVANRLEYSPDPVARILAKRKTQSLGLLFPQSIPDVFQNPYITEILRGFGQVCDAEGYSIQVLSPEEGIISRTIQNAAVDGMAILGVTSTSDIHMACSQRDMYYVTIDAAFADEYVNVGIDETAASRQMMELLLKKGHRKICICELPGVSRSLESEGTSTTMNARRKGIQLAVESICKDNDAEITFVSSDTSYNSAYKIAKEVLTASNKPTAVFCMSDIQTYGFYSVAQDLGLTIPQDFSIATFDNIPHAEILKPKPTTVNQPGFEKGRLAAEVLLEMLKGKRKQSVFLSVNVIETESVADIRK